MKKYVFSFVVLLATFVLTACHEESQYRNALPKDAACVMRFDLGTLADKSGINASESAVFKERLSNALKGEFLQSGELVDKIIEDPSETGLELTDDVYFFIESGMTSSGLLIRVSDKSKLENLLDELVSQHICSKLIEEEGCMWTTAGNALLAYTDDAFMAFVDLMGGEASGMKHRASMLLRQKTEDSFSSSNDFKALENQKGDMVSFFSYDILPQQYKSITTMGLPADINLKDAKGIMALSFEKGKVVIDYKDMTTDKVLKELMEQQRQAISKTEGTYLDAFSANAFCWLTTNVNGEKLFAFLKNYPSTRQLFETSMMPVDFEAIFKAINGDVSFAITDLEQVKFAMYANVSNNSFLQTIENLKPILALTGGQVTLVNKGPHAYEISMQNADWTGLPPTMKHLWIGVEEDRFYLTNDEPLIKAQVSGKTLKDMEWSKSVDGKYGFMVINFSALTKLLNSVPSAGSMGALTVLNDIDYCVIEGVEKNASHMELLMKDRSQNVLYQILKQFE